LKKIPINPIKRKQIGKVLRLSTWHDQFGGIFDPLCPMCNVNKIMRDGDWHCSHIVPVSCGGKDERQNLRPLCGSCNKRMASENMKDFASKYYPDSLARLRLNG
jgi:5-methylcytosine-specific restriction endonuclease McrA